MNAVSALAYAPMIRELPGGDGHGGWLLSASKNMLNLWECTSGAGDPALQVGDLGLFAQIATLSLLSVT